MWIAAYRLFIIDLIRFCTSDGRRAVDAEWQSMWQLGLSKEDPRDKETA